MPEFVSVIWDDAWADGTDTLGEHDHDSKHKPTVMETRGWLLGDSDVGVSLFNERCLDKGEEVYRSRTFILRSMIKSVTILNVTKPRKKRNGKKVHTPQDRQPSILEGTERVGGERI